MGESVKCVNGMYYFYKGSQKIQFPYVSTRKIMGSDAGEDEDISEVPVERQRSLYQFTEVQWPLWSLSFPFSPPVSLPLNLHIYLGGNVASLKN